MLTFIGAIKSKVQTAFGYTEAERVDDHDQRVLARFRARHQIMDFSPPHARRCSRWPTAILPNMVSSQMTLCYTTLSFDSARNSGWHARASAKLNVMLAMHRVRESGLGWTKSIAEWDTGRVAARMSIL